MKGMKNKMDAEKINVNYLKDQRGLGKKATVHDGISPKTPTGLTKPSAPPAIKPDKK